MLRQLFLVLCLGSSLTVLAQPAPERVLVPIAIEGQVPGANGSLWETRLAISNPGSAAVVVEGIEAGCNGICTGVQPIIEPGFTIFPIPLVPNGAFALLLHVGPGGDELDIHLRVQDVSRQADTWGTSIPVVRESDAFTGKFNLIDIPVDNARFRSLLRVYGFANNVDGAVLVRIFKTLPEQREPFHSFVPDALLAEHTLHLPATPSPYAPGYTQLPLWLLPEIPDGTRLRVEVSPLTGGRIWGFVSVTNNQTQHVTVIAPE